MRRKRHKQSRLKHRPTGGTADPRERGASAYHSSKSNTCVGQYAKQVKPYLPLSHPHKPHPQANKHDQLLSAIRDAGVPAVERGLAKICPGGAGVEFVEQGFAGKSTNNHCHIHYLAEYSPTTHKIALSDQRSRVGN